jgi:hypothetical protein
LIVIGCAPDGSSIGAVAADLRTAAARVKKSPRYPVEIGGGGADRDDLSLPAALRLDLVRGPTQASGVGDAYQVI